MRWAEIAEREPALGAVAREKLIEPGVLLVGTTRRDGAARLGWRPVVGRFTLFGVDIEEITYIGYDPDTGGQHVARWPAGVEYGRPATTPTSLGPPEPVRRLLTPP